MVRPKGLEPSREFSHNHLKVACLPIPPWPHIANKAENRNKSQIKINQVFFAFGEIFFIIFKFQFPKTIAYFKFSYY